MPKGCMRALVAREHVGDEIGTCWRKPSVTATRENAVCADELEERDFDIPDCHSETERRGIFGDSPKAEGAKFLRKGFDSYFVEKADERNIERKDERIAHSDKAAVPAVEVRGPIALERNRRVNETALWGH